MEIFQRFIQLYLLFGAINMMQSTEDCHCYEDCEALTSVINQQNQLRKQPGPDKEFIQSGTDTSTCKRNTNCCVPAHTCRKGWIQNEASCFLFVSCSQNCSVNEARSACEDEQAQLAKISSAAQESFFIRSLNKDIIILGGHLDKQGTWRWPDNSLFSDGYTNWQSGISSQGQRDCMVLVNTQWQKVPCKPRIDSQYSQGYICESSVP